ncbi:host specificity protein J [Escherichia coli]|nr:host specificity protein J [Escherichia coli]
MGLKLPDAAPAPVPLGDIRENDDGYVCHHRRAACTGKEAIVDNRAHFDGDQSGTVNGCHAASKYS